MSKQSTADEWHAQWRAADFARQDIRLAAQTLARVNAVGPITYQLFFRVGLSGRTVTLSELSPETTIREMKTQLEARVGLSAGTLNLSVGGRLLDDADTIQSTQLYKENSVFVHWSKPASAVEKRNSN